MAFDFSDIRMNLHKLRESSKSNKVFGSEKHRFCLHPTLSEGTIREFENNHRITLPSEYRSFLIHIGNGGAGPGYGLFKFGEMDDGFDEKPWNEDDHFIGILSKPFPHTAPWNDLSEKPFYDTTKENDPNYDYDDEYHWLMDAWEKRVYWNSAQVNGAIPICHLGCAIRQWLVITGPEAGNVWLDDRVDDGGLKPVQQDGNDRVTFLNWYRSWLNDAMKQLQ